MLRGKYKQQIRYVLRLVLIMAGTTLFSIWLGNFGIDKENTLMIFIVGVLLTTVVCTNGYVYGIVASVASVMIFNYFFTTPVHTFAMTNTNDIVLMFFFLVASFISSSLTVRFQKQLSISQKNEQTARSLYEMSSNFVNVTGKENIIQLGIRYIYEHTKYESAVELSDETVVDGSNGKYTSNDYMMVPIIGLTKQIGVLKVYNHNQGLSIEQELLIKTAANQIGIALDREMVYTEQENIKVDMEREHMKSSMLRSISHDFRTPLTGIMGDCSLIMEGENLDAGSIRQLAGDINEQALWLMKMMENILNMTKIESGKLYIEKQPEVVEDIVYEAASHVVGLYQQRKFNVSLPEDLIVAEMDGKMMVQVMTNLLDNAMKHTSPGGRISVIVSYRFERVYVQVEDDGEGADEKQLDSLFDEFFTSIQEGEDHTRGIGLGLAICKAVVTAHGGEIWAKNRAEGGARFTFWLTAKKVETNGK